MSNETPLTLYEKLKKTNTQSSCKKDKRFLEIIALYIYAKILRFP